MNRACSSAFLLVFAFCKYADAATVATVTEAVNDVDYGNSGSAHALPAKVGTSLNDGSYLKTGSASRAELEFPNQTVTRLGADTIFNYSAASNEVDLQAGTILFSKKKDGRELDIKTAAVTAAVVGTTGFAQVQTVHHQTSYLFGIIEGKATAEAGKKHYVVHSGEILLFRPGTPPLLFNFDLPRLVKTSSLITKFKHPLPNQVYIDNAVAQYESDEARGFILPSKGLQITDIYSLEIPAVPTLAWNSAGNQLNQLTQPPPRIPENMPANGSGPPLPP